MNNITALIMAAGTDDKMKSKKSKLAQTIYGKEVIKRVVNSVKKAGIEEVGVIVGENKEEIESILKDEVKYIYQEQCLGTGHAIMQAIPYLEEKSGRVLILNGNIPLITEQTIQKIVDKSIKEDEVATILTGIISEPKGYGRVIRKENKIYEVIEETDLEEVQKGILEVNAGVYCFKINELLEILGKLQHMNNGVTIEDMNTTYIYDDVEIGMDTIIHPNTTIKSGVTIGENCDIGPNAYIREGCKLANKVKIGSFVEIKKAIIAEGTKVPHLSYMGDCEIGTKCNIGCGTITCNYDGVNKHKTIIGDNSFIGSNVNFVAPVKVGSNVVIGAGSTITQDVPDNALGIARERQTNKENWKK